MCTEICSKLSYFLQLCTFPPSKCIVVIEISRYLATSSQPSSPEERATKIINKLPSYPNLITKTDTAILGTGLTAAAVSEGHISPIKGILGSSARAEHTQAVKA